MPDFLSFSLLNDYTFRVVALGTALLGLLCGSVGVFTTFSGKSLLGDALSHAALPGIVIAFLMIGHKQWLILLLGAAISGLIAVGMITFLNHHRWVKYDSALSLILSSFFGLGLVLLTYASRHPNANQAGLEQYIYGQASSMLRREVEVIAIASVFVIGLILLFWKELKVAIFDRVFAKSIIPKISIATNLISFLTVLVIVLSLQSVGVILTSALLVTPVIAARQWSNKLSLVVLLSGAFGMISGFFGTYISSSFRQVPTGPSVVVVLSVILIISLLFAPQRGLIARWLQHTSFKKQLITKVYQEDEK